MNHLAIFVSALSIFLLGGLWYSRGLFGKAWGKANGAAVITEGVQHKHPAAVYGSSFLFALIGAYAFAWIIGPQPEWHHAVHHGFLCGAGVAATSFGINYRFASRSWTLWAIDGGYHIVQFLLYGVILGLWH